MTRRAKTLVGMALGGLLLWVPVSESAAQTRTRSDARARCYRVSVSSTESPGKRRGRPKFSAAEILDLRLGAFVSRRMSGQHRIEFRIYTPNGNLYQSMQMPFEVDAAVDENGTRRRRFQEVTAVLPVAGTSIVSSSMYGTWSVEAFLDGDPRRCSRPRKFVIEP